MPQLHRIAISGPPRQRGRQYGEGLRTIIRERDEAWKAHIGVTTGHEPDHFIAHHLESTHYVAAVMRWAPDLLDEVRGIAEGANLPFSDIFAFQLMDEEWWFSQRLGGHHHCSGLGFSAAGRAVAGQTMDLPGWMDGFQTLLSIDDAAADLSAHVLTAAGMVGLCGMNSAGLGVNVNTLAQFPTSTSGLPVAFVSRGLLARHDVASASRFLGEVTHASGQNYILTDVSGVADFEASADGVTAWRPWPESQLVWHTNHPLTTIGGSDAGLAATGGDANSIARLAALDRRLAYGTFDASLAAMTEALAARDDPYAPIARDHVPGRHDLGFTFATVVWEIAPELSAHVAPGPAHAAAFETFTFDSEATPARVA